jgi:hypothetical protein
MHFGVKEMRVPIVEFDYSLKRSLAMNYKLEFA